VDGDGVPTALLLLVVGVAAFVKRNEAQLIAEAEKALPGRLKW
jgi:hypothetical protein